MALAFGWCVCQNFSGFIQSINTNVLASARCTLDTMLPSLMKSICRMLDEWAFEILYVT